MASAGSCARSKFDPTTGSLWLLFLFCLFFCLFVILDGNRTFKSWPRISIKKPTNSLTEYRSVPCSAETE